MPEVSRLLRCLETSGIIQPVTLLRTAEERIPCRYWVETRRSCWFLHLSKVSLTRGIGRCSSENTLLHIKTRLSFLRLQPHGNITGLRIG
jgi:hypothetical protein